MNRSLSATWYLDQLVEQDADKPKVVGLMPVQTTHLGGVLNYPCGLLLIQNILWFSEMFCLERLSKIFSLYLIYKILILSDVIFFSFKYKCNNPLRTK